jgi:predicted Zn-dependent peptidase
LIKKEILNNGLTLVTEAMPHVRSVAVGISLRRGSRHELDEESGLSHFIEHMVFKGTNRRSQVQIAREMDAIGGQADAFTTKEYASFHAKVLDEHLPVVMDILADILLNPSFDPAEIERERNVIIEEIKMVEDTHDELAHELFVESFWPAHPLGRSILGTRGTVEGFGRNDIIRFFENTYTPGNLIVTAAGNLTHENVAELTRKYFDSLDPRPNRSIESPPRVETAIRCREKDLEQVHLILGTVAPPHNHVDRYASYLLNTVLGGTMSSRLFQLIRETKGLAYSVFSGLTSYRDAGNLTVYAGMSPQNVSQVVDLVLDELRRIRHDPVTDEELRLAKDHIKGSIMLGLEGTGSRMSQLARHEMYFGRHISMDELLDGFERVTQEEVLRLASEMLEGRSIGLSAVGNLEHFNPVREKLVA